MKIPKLINIYYIIIIYLLIPNEYCSSQNNYFPIQVGNKWHFQTIPIDTNLSIQWNISDTIRINDLKYFVFNGQPIRKDSSGSILEYRDGKEIMWLNFTTTNDTTYTWIINHNDTFYVDKLMNLTIPTPIRSYDKCIEFRFYQPNVVDINNDYIFAPNIGPINYRNSMNPYELYAANINGEIITHVKTQNIVDSDYQLRQNYPNPFNSSTQITFSLKKSENVNITIFNNNGQYVNTIIDNYLIGGNYQITWSPADIPSGKYIIKLTSEHINQSIICVYLK